VRLMVRGFITSVRTTAASVLKFNLQLTTGLTMSPRNGTNFYSSEQNLGPHFSVGGICTCGRSFRESVTSLRLCNLFHMFTIPEFQLL